MKDTTNQSIDNQELYQKVTDICFENGSVSKPMVDRLFNLIEQEKIKARIDALDTIIDINSKQFIRWTNVDIANFFHSVGKYYRSIEAQLKAKDNK